MADSQETSQQATAVSDRTNSIEATLEALARGESAALADMYDQQADRVYDLALSLTGSHADACDVVQDVFVALPRIIVKYERRGSLEGWLQRVAARTALMQRRKAQLRREVKLTTTAEAGSTHVEAEAFGRLILDQALAQLPIHQRDVVILKVIEGFSHAEVAEVLGIAKGTSVGRLYKARRRLRRWLEADQPERTPELETRGSTAT